MISQTPPLKNLNGNIFDYSALRKASINPSPTAHVIVEDFISQNYLEKLLNFFPEIASGGSFPAFSFRHPPLFQQMLLEFTGQRLEQEICEKFNLPFKNSPKLLTLRGRTRPTDGKIHCDSKSKAVTILLYFNDPCKKWPDGKGCLRFLNRNDPKLLTAPCDENEMIAPKAGTLVIFPNSAHSWHGHLPYDGERRTIQLNYMHHSCKAWFEIKRHALSALWKKWHRV